MIKNILLDRWNENNINDERFDLFIACVGFERRARFIAESLKPQSQSQIACAFDNNKVHSYYENLQWYKDHPFIIEERGDKDFEQWCETTLQETLKLHKDTIQIGIDISSLSRFRIAALVSTIYTLDTNKTIQVDFFYSPSSYAPPSEEEGPIIICQPVIDKFAGWSAEPEKPTMAIFGLGYEYDKAIGAFEYIEPGATWAFIPYGEDALYDEEIDKANNAFWDSLRKDCIFRYKVDQPIETFNSIESLIYGNLDIMRPVLVPFGPKIFALFCFILGCIYYPRIAVWRVSSGPFEPAIDRLPNGKIIGIRTKFIPNKKM